MKIFIVQSHLGGGGAERVGSLLANGLAQRNHEVFMITNLLEEVQYSVDENVTMLNLVSSNSGRIYKWGSAVIKLRKYIRRYRPDVVIGIMELCSFIAKMAAIHTSSIVIATDHNSFERPKSAPMTKSNYFKKFYLNKIYKCVTVLTQADKEFIGNRLNNVVVMSNPLLLQPIENKLQKSNIVLAAGRLDDWHYKGFDILIKSFAKLLNGSKEAEPRSKFESDDIAFRLREDGWKLQIAGTGSEESLNYLKQLCKENGVDDYVEFLGFRKDVENLYQEASIFVLSSRYEGFGLVLIEAMSQGCACIACDYKGRQREIMSPTSTLPSREGESSVESPSLGTRNLNPETHNRKFEACETGILCEPDNVDALAEAMVKMVTDDDYRESVRPDAIERSKYYSIENTMDRWESLLTQLVS